MKLVDDVIEGGREAPQYLNTIYIGFVYGEWGIFKIEEDPHYKNSRKRFMMKYFLISLSLIRSS